MSTGATSTHSHRAASVSYSACSDIGMRREENQDSFGVLETAHFGMFLVADGMGGVQGGGVASNLAVETVKQYLQEKDEITATDICAAVEAANQEIYLKGGSDPALTGMGTTLVGLIFAGTSLFVLNVGDSRAYVVRNGRIGRLSEDHTLVMELLRSGTISGEQAQNHPVSHMLTRSLGPSEKIEVDCKLYPYGPLHGDRFLLCSDGLHNLVQEEEIEEILTENSLEAAVQVLVAKANERGGTDNITVVAVEVGDGFPQTIEGITADKLSMPGVDGLRPYVKDSVAAAGSSLQAPPEGAARQPAAARQIGDAQVGSSPEAAIESDAGFAVSSAQAESGAGPALQAAGPEIAAAPQAKAAASAVKPFGGFSSFRTAVLGLVAASIAGFAIGVFLYRPLQGKPGSLLRLVENVVENVEPPENMGGRETSGLPAGADGLSISAHSTVEAVEELLPSVQQRLPRYSVDNGSAIDRRREMLVERLNQINGQIAALDGPLSGRIGETLKETGTRYREVERELEQLRGEIDIATRKLAVWYGRRRRVESTEPVNLASEVAVSSERVRDRKISFEAATWEYLSEVEKLKYNPTDAAQARLVAELVKARRQRLEELAVEVRSAIDLAIGESDQRIAELTLQRDQLENKLRNMQSEMEFSRIVASGDPEAKLAKKNKLLEESEILRGEIDELARLAPVAGTTSIQSGAAANVESEDLQRHLMEDGSTAAPVSEAILEEGALTPSPELAQETLDSLVESAVD